MFIFLFLSSVSLPNQQIQKVVGRPRYNLLKHVFRKLL